MHRHTCIATALGVAAALAVTTGCGVGGGSSAGSTKTVASNAPLKGTITFQTWSLKNPTFTPYFTSLIKKFEGQHPGTTIKWIDQPGANYADKVISQVTAGNLPDVVNLPPDIAYSVAKTGGLLDLKKNVKTLDADYVANGRQAYQYPGITGTYGFPWYLGSDMNWWNKAMFQRDGLDASKPPTSLDGLVAQAKTMHDASHGKDYMMSRMPWLNDIVQSGTQLMNADETKFVFNTPAAAHMLDTYAKAYKAGYLPADVLTTAYQGNNAAFLKQQVAWTTGQGNGIQTVEQTNPSLAKNMVPSPSFGKPILNVQGISVAAKSKNLPLALAFGQYVTDNANQAAFIKLAPGFLPGTSAAAQSPQYSRSDGTPAGNAAVIGYQDLQKAVNYQPPMWTQDMTNILNEQFALAISGKESSQKALDTVVAKANEQLSD